MLRHSCSLATKIQTEIKQTLAAHIKTGNDLEERGSEQELELKQKPADKALSQCPTETLLLLLIYNRTLDILTV